MSDVINDPFSVMLGAMEQMGARKNPPGLKIGMIKSISPLVVGVDGLELGEDFIKIAEHLKPHRREVILDGDFNIKLNSAYTPSISSYSMPNKQIGLTATSTANVSNGNPEPVSVTVTTKINNDSHNHGSHAHTASSLTNVTGRGSFKGSIEYTNWGIKAGDSVLMLSTNDNQMHAIIAKI